ncbi:hypothetical protein [Paenibacillus sp. MER 99-2]|uniref:hypothetical protein n=1 Tax=Paenibacillus sp. MER 99-2 TaxID=2939572 RepID=UPI00203CC5FE|nr:hypothetical protein [Paenibacillus sp. MER 99-2]MCM3172989.1 hypothetical protein [Paenibacillus sp. MER 99-2]
MEISYHTIDVLKRRYTGTSQFYFSLFRHTKPMDFALHTEKTYLLKCLLSSEEFMEEYADFFPINEDVLDQAMVLNRYELEGSLISMFLQGTCTEPIVTDEIEARKLSQALLSDLRVELDQWVVFKLGNPGWSKASMEATLSCFYIVFYAAHRCWFILGFEDVY